MNTHLTQRTKKKKKKKKKKSVTSSLSSSSFCSRWLVLSRFRPVRLKVESGRNNQYFGGGGGGRRRFSPVLPGDAASPFNFGVHTHRHATQTHTYSERGVDKEAAALTAYTSTGPATYNSRGRNSGRPTHAAQGRRCYLIESQLDTGCRFHFISFIFLLTPIGFPFVHPAATLASIGASIHLPFVWLPICQC